MSYDRHPEWERKECYYVERDTERIYVVERERSLTRSGKLRPKRRIFRVFKVQERNIWDIEKRGFVKVRSVFCCIPIRANKGRDINYVFRLSRFRELFDAYDTEPNSNYAVTPRH